MCGRLLCAQSIHNTLIQISCGDFPSLGCEKDVVRIMYFRQMVERTALFGIRQCITSAIVFDGDVPLFDVDVGSAILSHGTQLHEMTVGCKLFNGIEHVDSSNHVVVLSEHGAASIDHRIRRRSLLSKVHDRFGLEGLEGLGEEVEIAYVTHHEVDVISRDVCPRFYTLMNRRDGCQRVHAQLEVERPATHVVHDGDLVASSREVKRRCPAAITITSDDHHALSTAMGMCSLRRGGGWGRHSVHRTNSAGGTEGRSRR